MMLQLAAGENDNYTFVPYDLDPTDGAYVRNDILNKAMQSLSYGDVYNAKDNNEGLSSFFGGLWNGIKKVASTVIPIITGQGGQQQQQPPIIIQQPPAPAGIDSKTLLIIGAGLAAVFLLTKKR